MPRPDSVWFMGELMTNLQATLSAATASDGDSKVLPHHPICCTQALMFDEDGALACDHTKVPPGDRRTQAALNLSLATLLIEEAVRRFG